MGEAKRKAAFQTTRDRWLTVANSQRSGDRHKDTEARRAYMAELMRQRRAEARQATPTPHVVDNAPIVVDNKPAPFHVVVDNETVETLLVVVTGTRKRAWVSPIWREMFGAEAIIRRASVAEYERFQREGRNMVTGELLTAPAMREAA
jgi:hypothetical protein